MLYKHRQLQHDDALVCKYYNDDDDEIIQISACCTLLIDGLGAYAKVRSQTMDHLRPRCLLNVSNPITKLE